MAEQVLGWRPQLTGRQAVEWTADWIRAVDKGTEMQTMVDAQIGHYEQLLNGLKIGHVK